MFLCRDDGPAIARIPKCGSTSITAALAPSPTELAPEAAIKKDVRVLFMRDPMERLASLFSFFHWHRKLRMHPRLELAKAETYEAMVDIALVSDDPHVVPQWDQVTTEAGVFVPNRVHKLSEIDQHWLDYYEGFIPHENHAQRVPVDQNYRRDEVAERYAKDIELWRSL